VLIIIIINILSSGLTFKLDKGKTMLFLFLSFTSIGTFILFSFDFFMIHVLVFYLVLQNLF